MWLLVVMFHICAFAHPSPNTLIFLDVSPTQVRVEVQLPLPELELAFGDQLSKDPSTLIQRYGLQLKEYLLAHVRAYANKDRLWQVAVANLNMGKGAYVDSKVLYWELNATIILTPVNGEGTRHFYLDYDAIIHQVANHAALVSIRSDWENGNVEKNLQSEVQAINWDPGANVIPPLEVNLEHGSWWTGFASMVQLGIRHIAEGTDHLMFLLVLLLPAPLIVRARRWGGFGGTRYSVIRLLKIVTAFTTGHSITLLLGSVGWLRLPSQPVEILIAVSILVSAVHAVRPLFPGREVFIAAGFGLIHGMAFASTLSNLHLDAGAMALSILGFNVGIELMQLLVIAITMPWLMVVSRHRIYKYVRVVAAVLAGIAAVAWIAQRFTNESNVLTDMVESTAGNTRGIVLALLVTSVVSVIWTRKGTTLNRR